MEKLGKRIVAGIMAGVLAVSLGLAPVDTVRAEEILPEGAGEVITADDVIGEQEEEAGSELEDDGAGDLESKISGENESEERQENPEENMAGEETEDALQETVTGEQDDESDREPANEPVEEEKVSEIAEGIDAVEQEGVLQVVETAEQAADIVSGTDWTLDADGKLTIRSDAGMKDWASKGKESYGEKIVSVEVQEGVTSIGDKAFYRCSGLNSITLPSSVINIGDNAFYECSSLNSITLPSGVISIGRWAFAYSGLTGIGIPSSVTSIGSNAFRDCSSLARVIMQGINPPALGSEAFTLCHFETNREQGIKIPLGTAEVYKAAWSDWVDYIDCVAAGNGIDWTLDGDGQLIIRSNMGMEDWRAVGKEKHGKKLVSVKIQAGVTDIGDGAFQYCSNLTSIELPLSVTDIGDYAFQYCSRLTGIELPSKVTDIGDYAFQYCSRLTGVEFPSKVTSIGDYAFQYCSRLTDIELPASITGIGDGAFQYCSRLTDMTLPPNVASIGNRAFNGCSCLESVTMQGITPPTLDIVNSGTGKTYVFDSCKFVEDNVKGIKVPSGTADAYKTAWPEWADYIAEDKAPVGDRDKVEVAKQAVEAVLAEIYVSNDTTEGSLEAAVQDAVKAALAETGIGSDGVAVTVENFTKAEATAESAGNVSADIKITCGTEAVSVSVNKTLDRLSVTPADKVLAAKVAVEAAVKDAIEKALAGTTVTNDNAEETAAKIKEFIPDAVVRALANVGVSADEVAAGEAGIEVQLADADTEGSINITIPLTSKEDAEQSDRAIIQVVVTKADEGDSDKEAEAVKAAQKMVEDAIKGITVTNETTKEDILALLKEGLGDKATIEGIGKFEKQDATEETTGNISIGVSVTVNGKTVAIDTSVVIPKLNRSDRKTGVTVRFTDYYDLDGSTPCYKYTGVAVRPVVEVYNNTELLTPGTDYTVGYKNNTKVSSTAALMIKGKGKFSGTSDMVGFNIINADIEKDTDHPTEMTVVANTKVAPIIMNGTKKLTTRDYRLEGNGLANGKYAAATEEGSPNTLIVKGIGSYAGSSFEIKVRVIEKSAARKLTVAVDRNFKPVYSGSTLNISSLIRKAQGGEGAIMVTDAKDRTKILKEGTDFTVLCTSSLCNSGTVNFTVTGMGEYTGSVNRSFRISPLKVTDKSKFSVAFDEQKAYEYSPAGTTVDNLVVKYLGEADTDEDDKILIQGVDYKVTYNNHKKVSVTRDAGFKITFLGNYRGSSAVSRTFKIVTAKLSAANTEVTVPDKVYSKANRAYKATPIVTVDGVAIKASNYTVSYAWATGSEAGDDMKYISDNKVKIIIADGDTWAKVRVTVTPKGNGCYSLDEDTVLEGMYYVRKINDATDLSRAKVTFFNKTGIQIKVLEYNGYPFYTPAGNNAEADNAPEDVNAVYVRVVVGGVVVDPELYEVIWTNATEKGKATVVIRGKGLDAGKGAAVGSKNQVISIKAMALKGKTLKFFMENAANMLESIF